MKFRSEIITSRSNSLVKWAASLSDKKHRDEEQCFLIEGKKLTFEAIEANLPIKYIFLTEKVKDSFSAELKSKFQPNLYGSIEFVVFSDSAFEKISTEKSPQGIISIVKYLDFFHGLDIIYKEDFFEKPDERALILASVRDPGNLGAVIRSAVAFGVQRIIMSSDCADVYNPKTLRGAMGTVFKIDVDYVSDLGTLIKKMRKSGRRVFAAELSEGASSLSEIEINKSDVFVIGNEGHGIPKEVSELCDSCVYIPISSAAESLNAAVAAAILMWEQFK